MMSAALPVPSHIITGIFCDRDLRQSRMASYPPSTTTNTTGIPNPVSVKMFKIKMNFPLFGNSFSEASNFAFQVFLVFLWTVFYASANPLEQWTRA